MNSTVVPPTVTLNNYGGILYIPDSIFTYLGCDTTTADFGFKISIPGLPNGRTANIENKQNTDDFNVLISPNPSNDMFSVLVQNTANDAPILFFVYDALGKPIYNEKGDNNSVTLIDLGNEPKGMYILKINVNNSNKYFKLILK